MIMNQIFEQVVIWENMCQCDGNCINTSPSVEQCDVKIHEKCLEEALLIFQGYSLKPKIKG